MTDSLEWCRARQSCNRVFLNCCSDLFVSISTPIFLGTTNFISQFVQGANTLELLEGWPSSYTPLPKCNPTCFCCAQVLAGWGNAIKSVSVAPQDLWRSSHSKLSSALWVTAVNWNYGSSFKGPVLSAGQKQIYQARQRIQSKLLGRFAPLHPCLTVLTNTLESLQPQSRIPGGTVSPPQVRHGNENLRVGHSLRQRENTTMWSPKLLQNLHEACYTT